MSKRPLVLLLAILIFSLYARPAREAVEKLKDELIFINAKIKREQSILERKKDFLKVIQKQQQRAEVNEKKMFASVVNDSIALGEIQSHIKKIALDIGMDFVSSNWGEPLKKHKYIKLPISFMLRGYPDEVNEFFKKLSSLEKIFKIERITIGKYKKEKLVLNFSLSGFKMMAEEQKGSESINTK